MGDHGEPGGATELLEKLAAGGEPLENLSASAENQRRRNWRQDPILMKSIPKALPLLADQSFVAKYPGVDMVAIHLHQTSGSSGEIEERSLLATLGVRSVNEWLELVKRGDAGAVRTYELMKDGYS